MRPRNEPASRIPAVRRLVLAFLAVNVIWVVALPLALTSPPRPVGFLLWFLVGALGIAFVLVAWVAVTPWLARRRRLAVVTTLLVVTVALWPLCFGWADPGQEPWAWVAGITAGVLPLVVRWPTAVAVGAALVAASAVGALLYGHSVLQNLAFAVGTAAVVVLMGQVMVWLLRLLVAVDAGREAEATLAVSQERLRIAQELHDVLGHQLTVIALKAEVASNAAATDPTRARAEADQIRSLATATLQDVRTAVHGVGTLDLAEQVRTAELVLASAGIEAEIDFAAQVALDPQASQLVAAVVRESVTNLLRHSQARRVTLDLTADDGGCVTLTVRNDGAGQAATTGSGSASTNGTGLSGLAGRCAAAGARLQYGLRDGLFEVRLELGTR